MDSIKLNNSYIDIYSSITSFNENINSKYKINDLMYGENNSENAQEKMINTILNDIIKRKHINSIIGADLSNQLATSSNVVKHYNIPYLGVYSACSSFTEELLFASLLLSNNKSKQNILCLVSSHNLCSEKNFRYPVEYGTPQNSLQTYTLTAALGVVVTNYKTNIKLDYSTIGNVVDYGIKDANNMGAIMAPAAADTLLKHLNDLGRDVNYYDVIITGDLGKMGSELFKLILSKNNIKIKNHIDAGACIIDNKCLSIQGGSGPVCLPIFFLEKILHNKKYRKILLLGTGALHNKSTVNFKKSIPAICHAISLEVTR